jgi:hypothetical protein
MVSRRHLLKSVPMLAGAAMLGFPLFPADAAAAPEQSLVAGEGASVSIVNLASGKRVNAPLGFMPHSFVQHPRERHKVWAIERWDYAKTNVKEAFSVAEVDMRTGTTLRQFNVPEGSGFFGHGFFAPAGDVLFISRVDIDAGKGYLTGYDVGTFKSVANFEIQLGSVHECQLLEDGTLMAVCSGVRPLKGHSHLEGIRVEKGALFRMELKSGRILDKKIVEDDGQMAGHCGHMKTGASIVLSRPKPPVKQNGRIYFTSGDGPLRAVDMGEDISVQAGECLSVAVNDREHRAIVTNPENKTLLVIDTREGRLIEKLKCLASGVAYDPRSNRFIASGEKLSLISGRASRFEEWPEPKQALMEGPFTSPHCLLV